ncbi:MULTISPECIES: hypothetical protein [Pseudomonas]|uniref:Uncharacterized protein n=1 Tax=Pseudomonas putida NBRC 14164 TaxID=1211579 RepID=A0ABN5ULG5_PSEPU|nr:MULTISPECIES: hypothetical protein [Pseudomonas]EKT4555738.1 hypothetical protein [Pseudomonas putida]MBH3391061.1 hypothetical protein [Pseudomonas putida]MCX9136945.1 hypothetical protein [Pseudomonas sp. DCB_PUT]MDD1970729.1 hypothetical protein [Pseudomonas putida]MDO1464569.1 hypothetical protein [Pseudomonas putida]
MSTENIETLLERLVAINEEVSQKLDDIKYDLSEIKNELNWVGEHSYAKVVYDGLNNIEMRLIGIESNTSSL